MNEKLHTHLRHVGGYRFNITFDELTKGKISMDEPEPLGGGEAPDAGMMLSSAVGHCLSASLIFCMEKSRVKLKDLETEVETTLQRNERGRWRVGGIKVNMKPIVEDIDREKLDRCLGLFEDFCIVTTSVRNGIKIDVDIEKG